jgi:hypothetical protein
MALSAAGRRLVTIAALCLALAAALGYLRDPPWLARVTSGFDDWRTDAGGTRFRWMSAHGSFFVPADAKVIEIPLRTEFGAADDPPIAARISIDDRAAAYVELTDPSWRTAFVRLPAPGSRRLRRIDIQANRTRRDDAALQVGEIRVR